MVEPATQSDSSLECLSTITEEDSACQPQTKKPKLEEEKGEKSKELENRLGGILCCTVCLDLPWAAIFQCANGHLMCAACMSHLLADARLKDETATCPNCRCEISRSLCCRNLAVEKAIAELPDICRFCQLRFPRASLNTHEKEQCSYRLAECHFERIGCQWKGPIMQQRAHETNCCFPQKTGEEILEWIKDRESEEQNHKKILNHLVELLSLEKVTFSDLQLKPYRTDDFIPRLFYETSRFQSLGFQWLIRGRINDNAKQPSLQSSRSLSYQLVLKSKTASPVHVHYTILMGPFSDLITKPLVYEHCFESENAETPFRILPVDTGECNRLLADRTINFRLILFQLPD